MITTGKLNERWFEYCCYNIDNFSIHFKFQNKIIKTGDKACSGPLRTQTAGNQTEEVSSRGRTMLLRALHTSTQTPPLPSVGPREYSRCRGINGAAKGGFGGHARYRAPIVKLLHEFKGPGSFRKEAVLHEEAPRRLWGRAWWCCLASPFAVTESSEGFLSDRSASSSVSYLHTLAPNAAPAQNGGSLSTWRSRSTHFSGFSSHPFP